MASKNRQRGRIIKVNWEREYGFIRYDEDEIFFHFSKHPSPDHIQQGDLVEFEVKRTRDGKTSAIFIQEKKQLNIPCSYGSNCKYYKQGMCNYFHQDDVPDVKDNSLTFENLLDKLKKNDCSLVAVDLQNQNLTKEEIVKIHQRLENNNVVGNIKWGKNAQMVEIKETAEKIEKKIINNNQNYKHHPNDLIHGLLCSHAFTESKAGESVQFDDNKENDLYNQCLQNWKVFKVFNKPECGKYYGVLYINHHDHQLVLAHRGAALEFAKLRFDSSLQRNIQQVLQNGIVDQQNATFKVVKEATDQAKEMKYHLSMTGYSLGAWLAELSTYFCYLDFNYRQIKTVTFNSPGSVESLEKFGPNVINHETAFDIRNMNIVTYLSAPNFINSCNLHVGKLYRLFPKRRESDLTKKLVEMVKKFSKNTSFMMEGLLLICGHKLDNMLQCFNPITGEPTQIKEISDCPYIKYVPKQLRERKMCTLKSIGSSFISQSTLETMLAIVGEFFNGNIQAHDSFADYKLGTEKYEVKQDLCDTPQFHVSYEGQYKTKDRNLTQDTMSEEMGGVDWYLKMLRIYGPSRFPNLFKLTTNQLKKLTEQYEIEIKHGKERLIAFAENANVSDIREQMLRLLEVDEDLKPTFDKHQRFISEKIANDVPRGKIDHFIRENILNQLNTTLKNNQCAAIVGVAGTGKSSIALQYAHTKKDENMIVRWIESDSTEKLKFAYHNFAVELGIKVENTDMTRIIKEVNAKLGDNFFLVFDNVEKYDDIQQYLSNLPIHVKAIITTKDHNINNQNEKITRILLKEFDENEAKQYLKSCFGNRFAEQDIDKLIKRNGRLPLKLSQTVAYFDEEKLSDINEYSQNQANANQSPADRLLGLLMKDEKDISWKILQYAARLDADCVNLDIIKRLLLLDEDQLEEPLQRLESLSLVSMVKENTGLKLHRLLQEEVIHYARTHADQAMNEKTLNMRLVKVLNDLMPTVNSMPDEKWKLAKLYYCNVIKILNILNRQNSDEIASLFHKLGTCCYHMCCDYEKTLDYYEKALETCKKLHNGNHANVAHSLALVGEAFEKNFSKNDDNLNEALHCHQQALDMRLNLYHDEHPDVAQSLDKIGVVYDKLGDSNKGLKNKLDALEIRRKYHDDPDPIFRSLSHVAIAYGNLKKFDLALQYNHDSLTMRKKLHGENHSTVAACLHSIGVCYDQKGDYKNALLNYRKALNIREKLYQGTNHHDLCISRSKVAKTKGKLNSYYLHSQ